MIIFSNFRRLAHWLINGWRANSNLPTHSDLQPIRAVHHVEDTAVPTPPEEPSPAPARAAHLANPSWSTLTRVQQRLGWLGVGVGLVVMSVAMTVLLMTDPPLLSPISASSQFQFITQAAVPTSKKIVYGFLPYWNVNKTTLQPELTHLAYFGLNVNPDGSFTIRTEDGPHMGYHRLQSEAWLNLMNQAVTQGKRIDITLVQFNNDDIVSIISNPSAQEKMLEQLDAVLLAYPVSGVNIDFEYAGEITPQIQDKFARFVENTSLHLKRKYSGIEVSIDVYASASSSQQIWDIPRISKVVDYIVVMAYDFHQRSSPQAGPVAPLFGGKEYWSSDISMHLQRFLEDVPSEKILLGVPFYGYGWQTTDREAQASTFPGSGFTASFTTVENLIQRKDEIQLEENWNEDALSPYITYQEDGETYVIYYENSRSLSYKLDFVNQLDLGGIAIWALGYEADSRELWDVVERKVVVQ